MRAIHAKAALFAWLLGLILIVIWPRALDLTLLGAAAAAWLARSLQGRRVLLRRLRVSLPWLLVIALSWLISEGRAGFEQGALQSAAFQQAALQQAMPALRILVAAVFSGLCSSALTRGDWGRVLRRSGLPSGFVELLLETRAFLVGLRATLTSALAASALRGGRHSLRATARTAGPIAGLVLVRSLDRGQRRMVALSLRGHWLADTPARQP